MLFSYTNPCFNPRVPNLRTISSFTSALPKFYARVEHQGDKHLRQAQRLQDSLPGTRHHTDASGCPAEKKQCFQCRKKDIKTDGGRRPETVAVCATPPVQSILLCRIPCQLLLKLIKCNRMQFETKKYDFYYV